MSIVANEAQLGFLKGIKDIISSTSRCDHIVYEPPMLTAQPRLRNFYVKPVVVIAPDLQFPGNKDDLRCPTCFNPLNTKGWEDSYRYVHGLSSGFFLLQKRYICKSANCQREHKNIDALTLLKEATNIPEHIRLQYPLYQAGTLWFHSDLATAILNDAFTAKTFDESCETIKSSRLREYLNKRAIYESLKKSLEHSLAPVQDGDFSNMNDAHGYNELLCPDATTVVEFVNCVIEENDDFIQECFAYQHPTCLQLPAGSSGFEPAIATFNRC